MIQPFSLGARGLSIRGKLGRGVFEAEHFAVAPDALFHLRLAFFATRLFLAFTIGAVLRVLRYDLSGRVVDFVIDRRKLRVVTDENAR